MNLIDEAIKAMQYSYSPYSKFKVGCALLTNDEKIFTGCNIESISFSPTTCAERVAFNKAISEGYKNFKSIAVVGGLGGKINDYCIPCGVCLQLMAEFCKDDFVIYVTDGKEIKKYLLKDLLPHPFRGEF